MVMKSPLPRSQRKISDLFHSSPKLRHESDRVANPHAKCFTVESKRASDLNLIRPSAPCGLCSEDLGLDSNRPIIRVEAGEMSDAEKPFFVPTLSRFFHLECYLRLLDFNRDVPLGQCASCGVSLLRERWIFRLKVGDIVETHSCFMPLPEPKNLGLLCASCVLEGFGDGDREKGERFLHAG